MGVMESIFTELFMAAKMSALGLKPSFNSYLRSAMVGFSLFETKTSLKIQADQRNTDMQRRTQSMIVYCLIVVV